VESLAAANSVHSINNNEARVGRVLVDVSTVTWGLEVKLNCAIGVVGNAFVSLNATTTTRRTTTH
jgi:hypothetical protein